MNAQEQALMRLRVYVAHFIDHTRDHVAEIEAQRPHIENASLGGLLEKAVADVEAANRSLQAVLTELGGKPDDGHHHHGHHHA